MVINGGTINQNCYVCVCVLHIKPFFYSSTSSTPSVRTDSSTCGQQQQCGGYINEWLWFCLCPRYRNAFLAPACFLFPRSSPAAVALMTKRHSSQDHDEAKKSVWRVEEASTRVRPPNRPAGQQNPARSAGTALFFSQGLLGIYVHPLSATNPQIGVYYMLCASTCDVIPFFIL